MIKQVTVTTDGTIIDGEEYCYRRRSAAWRASRRSGATPDYFEYHTPDGEARYLARGGYFDDGRCNRDTYGPGRALVSVVVRYGDECDDLD